MDPVMHRMRTTRLTPVLLVLLALLAASLLAGCRPVAASQPIALVTQEDLPAEIAGGDPILITGLANIQPTEDMTAPEDLPAGAIALVIGPRSEFPAGLADSALALVDADAVAGMSALGESNTTIDFPVPLGVTGLSEFPASGLVYIPADLLAPGETTNSPIDVRNGVPVEVTTGLFNEADNVMAVNVITSATLQTMVELWDIDPTRASCVPTDFRCKCGALCCLFIGGCKQDQPVLDN